MSLDELRARYGLDDDCYLFLGDPDGITHPLLNKVWLPGGGTFLGAGTSLFANSWQKVPLFSAAHRTVGLGLLGLAVGIFLEKKRIQWGVERDLRYFQYMASHPEDFKPVERVKYADVLRSWVPVR